MIHSDTLKRRINGHAHLLPYPHQIPKFMRDKKLFWITDDMNFMCQGEWRRPITDPAFFLTHKMEWMYANDIDQEVLLNLSQLYCNGYSRQDTQDVIRFQNDFNASIQHEIPEKFISGFVVQPCYMDDALKEIELCTEKYQLPLLCLPTHYLDHKKQWKSIADDDVLPIFEMAQKYKLAIEIHPYNAEEIISLQDEYWRFHLIWMCAQTADAYHLYSIKNMAERFPDVRVCFAHGNQFGQIGYGRRVQGFLGRPDLFEGGTNPTDNIRAVNVFFDSIVHDVLSFELLVKRQGFERVVAGLDDPYPLGEMDTVPGCYPGKVLDEALAAGIITTEQKEAIWCDNVLTWLYGNY